MALARAVDGLADEAPLAAAIGEDALEGTPAGLAHALAGQQPDRVIRADGDDIAQPQPLQRAGELPTLPVEAVGQDDAEAKAQRHQLFNDGDRQVRLALGDIALLEARPGLEDAEEQRETWSCRAAP